MNKYLEKIAGPYFYDKAKHFAQHADDLAGINRQGFPGKSFHRRFDPPAGKTRAFEEVSARRIDALRNKTRLKYPAVGGAIGSGIGGSAGYSAETDEKGRKYTNSEKKFNGFLGAVYGGIVGASIGHVAHRNRAREISYRQYSTFGETLNNNSFKKYQKQEDLFTKERRTASDAFNEKARAKYEQEAKNRHSEWESQNNKFWEDFNKRKYEQEAKNRHSEWKSQNNKFWEDFNKSESEQRSSGFNRRGTSSIHDLHKDLEFPEGGFKTKAEATKHYRRMSMKHHPDRGGSVDKMSKINAAWDKYKVHPEGFEKLAGFGIGNFYVDFFL